MIKQAGKVFVKYMGHLKTYFQSLGFYFGFLNFIMLIANTKKLYGINITLFLLIPIVIIIAIGWARFDYKYIQPHYFKHMNQNNDAKQQLNVIENKIDMVLNNDKRMAK